MIESDAVKLAIPGGVILLTALLALRSGRSSARHAAIEPRFETVSGAQTALANGRPRILTGEPAAPEQRKPAPTRALRLVTGITTLAVIGAVGLIVIVRALIEMFRAIGG